MLHDIILYAIANEIHHRGQGYVYLRALGIEPPSFCALAIEPSAPLSGR